MSEPKRATLSTISTQKSDVKKVKETSKTIRFSLNLPESNEKSCPEYNYRDLLNSAEKKAKLKEKPKEHPNGLNNLDPFNDDDDSDVKRIAAKFEQKYGLPPTTKRRNKKDDYADIGAGYDESDSFIDNTDAYDEMVPEDVTTLHGGFYINSGALEFKTVELSGPESSDSEPEDTVEKSANRKRIIEDSDETDSEEEKDELKAEHVDKKQKIEMNGVQKPVKKKIILDDKDKDILIKKKKIEENILKKKQITVKDLLREKREEFDMIIEPVEPEPEKPADQKDQKPASKTIIDTIESVVNAGRAPTDIVDEASKDSSSSDSVAVVSPDITDSESSRDGIASKPESKEPSQIDPTLLNQETEIIPMVKLPDNLPTSVCEVIASIKKAAENSEGKVKFFSGPVNTMLLNLEMHCRKLSKSIRLQIYEHLAPFVKCKKDTLMRRAKNLVMDNEKDKIDRPLKRLKSIVDETMPIVMKCYEKEFQKHRDEMFQLNANANAENGEVNPKARRAPRKKYPWSEKARKALQDVILFKKKQFTLDISRKEAFELVLEVFLKTTIIPLWPDGWMSFVALTKQVKIVLDIIQKPKILPNAPPMLPISLDISTPINPTPSFAHSPVNILSPSSAITVIPITPTSQVSPKAATTAAVVNGPKKAHSPTIPGTTTTSVKPNDITVMKPETVASVLNLNPEISIVSTKSKESCSLLIPSSKSVASVDLRTNQTKHKDEEEEILIPVTPIIPKRIEPPDDSDECQIIDLTDSPVVIRKAGPKSKTRLVDGVLHKHKRVKDLKVDDPMRRNEEISGTQALNQIITGLTKFGSTTNEVKPGFKETAAVNEDEMEQVMKDLKELQQLQEHARKNEIDIMAPSSSPVSVIAFNSAYSPNSRQPSDLTTKERKSATVDGFQELYQKNLYGDVLKSASQSSSVYNSNVQPKNNFNSVNNFSYSTSGSISNTMNNIRYPQNPSKYTAPISHLPPTTTGATNHTDDFALFQNFLYQYGFHNASGSKQKSPP